MKSKSFDLKKAFVEKSKQNKTFDFISLYKSTAETNKTTNENCISSDVCKDLPPKGSRRTNSQSRKCQEIPNKNNKNDSVSISQIDIDGSSLNCSLGASTSYNDPKITSTPNSTLKSLSQACKVKSIMKNTSVTDDFIKDTESAIKHNSKKRNKSVSFMLEDNEDVAVKKIKPDNPNNASEKPNFFKTISLKKFNKIHHTQKEIKGDINQNVEHMTKAKAKISKITNEDTNTQMESNAGLENTTDKSKRKKIYKKPKKFKNQEQSTNVIEHQQGIAQSVETKAKKIKKKKHQVLPQLDEGEPATKARKTEIKPDIIAEDLENLNIGDNTHTLSNLLDEMTVVDKNKRKKSKSKLKEKTLTTTPTTDSSVKIDGEKEKIKWKKRKWNKDKKGDIDTDNLNTSIIVENLPIAIVLTYKNILAEYFEKYGLIKKIGIAEVYPTEESKPVFTTTVKFYSDGAATQALGENNSVLEGNRIGVKPPLPATETTLVLRSYAELNEQSVTSLFTGTGKIRNIRHLVKGKKAMSTAFVEFDGPESVERAMKKCKHSKIGSKKVHISRFEVRSTKVKPKADVDEANDINKSDAGR